MACGSIFLLHCSVCRFWEKKPGEAKCKKLRALREEKLDQETCLSRAVCQGLQVFGEALLVADTDTEHLTESSCGGESQQRDVVASVVEASDSSLGLEKWCVIKALQLAPQVCSRVLTGTLAGGSRRVAWSPVQPFWIKPQFPHLKGGGNYGTRLLGLRFWSSMRWCRRCT